MSNAGDLIAGGHSFLRTAFGTFTVSYKIDVNANSKNITGCQLATQVIDDPNGSVLYETVWLFAVSEFALNFSATPFTAVIPAPADVIDTSATAGGVARWVVMSVAREFDDYVLTCRRVADRGDVFF